jgi:hypothetical protein
LSHIREDVVNGMIETEKVFSSWNIEKNPRIFRMLFVRDIF